MPEPNEHLPSIDSPAVQALLVVLSFVAGATDVISFLGLDGLFTAHITGNLVILAAHIVIGDPATLAPMLSVPVFIIVIILTKMLAGRLESGGVATLRPLMILQFVLLAGFLALCIVAGPGINPNATNAIIAGMLGVSAMAVQNALVQFSLRGAPSTAAMTSNVTRFAMDLGELWSPNNPASAAEARKNVIRILPVIIGFAAGCAIGGVAEASFGMRALALPTALALLACGLTFSAG